MKSKWALAILAIAVLATPRLARAGGVLEPTLGMPLVNLTTREVEVNIGLGLAFIEARVPSALPSQGNGYQAGSYGSYGTAPATRPADSTPLYQPATPVLGYATDPAGRNAFPFGVDTAFRPAIAANGLQFKRAWIVVVANGVVVDILGAMNGTPEILVTYRRWVEFYQRIGQDPSTLSVQLVVDVENAGRRETRLQVFIFVFKSVSTYDVRKSAGINIIWDNWMGWMPGRDPIPPTPNVDFLRDRMLWNRATEVSDVLPAGQDAGFDNWVAKHANQLGPGNALMARVRYRNSRGEGVPGPRTIGLLFFTRKSYILPASLPGSLTTLHRLPSDWHVLPQGLRDVVRDCELTPWLLVWHGSRYQATFVITRDMRRAVKGTFPTQPGMRRAVIVGGSGMEGANGLPLAFSTEVTGEDVRVLVPRGTASLDTLGLAGDVATDELDDTYDQSQTLPDDGLPEDELGGFEPRQMDGPPTGPGREVTPPDASGSSAPQRRRPPARLED